jgi:hypothetical protein
MQVCVCVDQFAHVVSELSQVVVVINRAMFCSAQEAPGLAWTEGRPRSIGPVANDGVTVID